SYSSDQAIIQRYLTTKDEPAARRSIWLNGIISIPVAAIFFFIGTAMFAFYKNHPQALNPTMDNPDAIFPFFIMSELPVGMSGILIAAVFSAAMSTLSSNINSVATAFTTDFYRRFKPASDEQTYLKVARISSFLVGALGMGLALLMATWEIKSLFDQFNIFLGLFASGLGGLFAMGIFTRRIHGAGALIGLLSSAFVLAVVKRLTPVSFLLYGFIGLASCVVTGYLSSMLIPWPKKSSEGLTIYSFKPNMTK
ncbi:MAG: hypothetical protein ACE5HX_16090, partial [bacterium]